MDIVRAEVGRISFTSTSCDCEGGRESRWMQQRCYIRQRRPVSRANGSTTLSLRGFGISRLSPFPSLLVFLRRPWTNVFNASFQFYTRRRRRRSLRRAHISQHLFHSLPPSLPPSLASLVLDSIDMAASAMYPLSPSPVATVWWRKWKFSLATRATGKCFCRRRTHPFTNQSLLTPILAGISSARAHQIPRKFWCDMYYSPPWSAPFCSVYITSEGRVFVTPTLKNLSCG